jgi:hypothetical protein
MPEQGELFTGAWRFNAKRSKLSTPTPQSWIQEIVVTRDEIVVHENIVRSNGEKSVVRVWARFDGSDYPVSGLPIADFIAYTRVDNYSISGTGKKNGVVTVNETITVAQDGGTLTLIYSVQTGASPVARGLAVFDRQSTQNLR